MFCTFTETKHKNMTTKFFHNNECISRHECLIHLSHGDLVLFFGTEYIVRYSVFEIENDTLIVILNQS